LLKKKTQNLLQRVKTKRKLEKDKFPATRGGRFGKTKEQKSVHCQPPTNKGSGLTGGPKGIRRVKTAARLGKNGGWQWGGG